MAITTEQKSINKEASLLKKAAHSARTRELDEAKKSSSDEVNSSQLGIDYNKASDELNAAIERREFLVNEVRAQIILLEEKIKDIKSEQDVRVEVAINIRKAASTSFRNEMERRQEEVEVNFPDLEESSARWSSVTWIPPAGYLEQFAAEHADELAGKKAKRDKKATKKTIS